MRPQREGDGAMAELRVTALPQRRDLPLSLDEPTRQVPLTHSPCASGCAPEGEGGMWGGGGTGCWGEHC